MVLVHVDFRDAEEQERLDEFQDLARSTGVTIAGLITASRDRPDPAYFVGRGKVDEIREAVLAEEAGVVLFNHGLSPAQERNLERALKCRVLDRTGLILDIFAQRARSYEGKLQVELAQLRHLSTRLVRGWTHLERQKGGIGLRGPGEKQLETDRRLLAVRIKHINRQLTQVSRKRELQRRSRRKARMPVVSLVGYTNAGKSTLFNRLTDAGVLEADKLFATLDPTLRRVEVGHGRAFILADTVGFIRHLPHDLVAAFRSTLEETRDADLLLHVVDAADPEHREKMEQVNEVLEAIGAAEVPVLLVYNKVDALAGGAARADADEAGAAWRVWLSAHSGEGLDLLREELAHRFVGRLIRRRLCLPSSAGRLRARLHDLDAVITEQAVEEGWHMDVEVEPDVWQRLHLDEAECGAVAGAVTDT